jgi:hypothetical protein
MSAANESMPFTPDAKDYDATVVWWSRQHPRRWSERRVFIGRIIRAGLFSLWMALAMVGGGHLFGWPPLPLWQFGAMASLMWLCLVSLEVLARRWPSLFHPRWSSHFPPDRDQANRKEPSRQIRVTPDGLASLLEGHYHEYAWGLVSSPDVTASHCFFTVDDYPVAVPRRAFLSEEHFREFVALVEQYRQQALAPGTPA